MACTLIFLDRTNTSVTIKDHRHDNQVTGKQLIFELREQQLSVED